MPGSRRAALVGRDRELRLLVAAVAAARARHGGLYALTGEGGIGKTRLATELASYAADEGFATAWGSAWPGGGAPPLWPWHELLGQLGTSHADDLLSLHGHGDAERFARFRAVGAELARLAVDRPLLLVVDDLHAVDPAAALLVRFAARSLRQTSVLLVVTCRDEAAPGPETDAVLADSVQLALHGLTGDDLAAFAVGVVDDREPVDTIALAALTGGNPLLVQEALATADPNHIPQRVRSVLVRRLSAVPAERRAVLAAAAVLGRSAADLMLAALTGVPVTDVSDAHGMARAAGLLLVDGDSRWEFAHALLGEALLDDLGIGEVARLHAAAAATLRADDGTETGSNSAERRRRIARHLLAAAGAGAVPWDEAVDAARSAASDERAAGAHEQAAQTLRTAVEVVADPAAVPAGLWLELAQAELAGGRLKAARAPFRSALAAADADAVQRAEAALGLGGIWVYEHREPTESERYLDDLTAAIAGLGDRRPDLGARLRARLAAERVYRGTGSPDAVRHEVDALRRMGDDRGLAETLSLSCHVLLGPHDATRRRAAVDELVEVAARTGDTVFVLLGALWRTIDEFLHGSPDAERSLAELRQRADALRVDAVLYVAELIDVMLALRAGRVEEAEHGAQRCADRGAQVGDADAFGYFGAQLLCIRWLQARSGEILPLARELAASPLMVEAHPVYPAAVAALAADASSASHEEAWKQLDAVDVARIAPSSNWLLIMTCVVEASAELGDRRSAAAAYTALLPFAGLPIMASLGIVCLGSAERVLGLAARTLDRTDDAIAHFERAVEANRQLGNRPMLAMSRGDLGRALADRGRPGDSERGCKLRASAVSALDAMNLTGRADRYREPENPLLSQAILRRTGDSWEVINGDERCVVADGIGMRHLARLLAAPGQDVPADDLALTAVRERARQDVLDDDARRRYRRRIHDLRRELDSADSSGDVARAEQAQGELDTLVAELAAANGLGGRPRTFADSRERSRTAVQKAIGRALARIDQTCPDLAATLRASVHTGLTCRYDPADGAPARWTVESDRVTQSRAVAQ